VVSLPPDGFDGVVCPAVLFDIILSDSETVECRFDYAWVIGINTFFIDDEVDWV
jgi:hypothetical protein